MENSKTAETAGCDALRGRIQIRICCQIGWRKGLAKTDSLNRSWLLAQFGTAGGVLDGAMAEPILNCACVMSRIGAPFGYAGNGKKPM